MPVDRRTPARKAETVDSRSAHVCVAGLEEPLTQNGVEGVVE